MVRRLGILFIREILNVGQNFEGEQWVITVEGENDYLEAPTQQAGFVKEINVSVGYKTVSGKLILFLDSAEGAAGAAPAQEEKKEAAPAAAPAAAAA
ncbi:pyruvate dehydrogenase complex dihydrolipoyllysine-residue acetyltransferase, partial [Enterobacter hormaechei]